MESKKKDNEVKRAYEKPKLLTIELALNEVLGIGCKMSTGGGGFAAPCSDWIGACANSGS